MPIPRRNETREQYIARSVPAFLEEGSAKTRAQAETMSVTIWDQRDSPMVHSLSQFIKNRNHLKGGFESRRDYDSRQPFFRSDMVLTPSELVASLKEVFPGASVVSIGGDEYHNLEVHVGLDDLTPVASIRIECDYSNNRPKPIGYLVWDRSGNITTFDELVDRLRGLGATA